MDIEVGSRIDAPTWIPDWLVKRSPQRNEQGLPVRSKFIDLASSTARSIAKSDNILVLEGCFIDSILATGSVLPLTLRGELYNEESARSALDTIRGWLAEMQG
jgi:hypothetical protein